MVQLLTFQRKRILKRRLLSGYVLTCVGDERSYSFVKTPNENTIADTSMKAALFGKSNVKEYSYIDRGSDERQYCAPGVELPVCSFQNLKLFRVSHK